jgi:uncharacterized protein YbaR (Trm112 family)
MPDRFDPKLLSWIGCPLTKAPLRFDEANQELVSDEVFLVAVL